MNSSYISIPTSILEHPKFINATPEHVKIFMILLRRAAYCEMEFDIMGEKVKLLPGQACYSIRYLAEICGRGITKNNIEGFLRYFSTHEFLRHEVRHQKTIITFIHPDICNTCFKSSQTPSQTRVRQQSDTKESNTISNTESIYKKENKKEKASPSAIAASLASFFLDKILEMKSDFKKPNLQRWSSTIDFMINIDKRSPGRIREVIEWVTKHEFWSKNCLSADKLRKHFDTLELQMKPAQKEMPKAQEISNLSQKIEKEIFENPEVQELFLHHQAFAKEMVTEIKRKKNIKLGFFIPEPENYRNPMDIIDFKSNTNVFSHKLIEVDFKEKFTEFCKIKEFINA
jgi:hypothetical protein